MTCGILKGLVEQPAHITLALQLLSSSFYRDVSSVSCPTHRPQRPLKDFLGQGAPGVAGVAEEASEAIYDQRPHIWESTCPPESYRPLTLGQTGTFALSSEPVGHPRGRRCSRGSPEQSRDVNLGK